MSRTGDHGDEMAPQPVLDDHEIAALLAAEGPRADGELTELARFVQQVRHAAAGPAPRVSPRLEAVLVHGLTDGPPGPRVTARSKGAMRMLTRVTVVAGGLSLAATGAAAADLLPRPAQDGVAALVEGITPLDVPDSDDGTEPPAPEPSQPPWRPGPQQQVGSEAQEHGRTGGGAVETGERPQGGATGAVTGNVANPSVAEKQGPPARQGNGGSTTRPQAPAEPGPQPVPPGRGHVPDPSTPAPAQPRAGDNPGAERRP